MAGTDSTTDTDTDNVGTITHRSLLILIWTCFSAAFALVAVRTVIRLRSPSGRRLPPADDCLIFFALASLLALCVLETVQLPSLFYITGILAGTVPISSAELIVNETENYLLYQFPIVILFWTVLWSVKAAFLALYWRLFRDLTWYRRAWYFLAGFTFLAYGGCLVTLTLSCGTDVRNFFRFDQCAGADRVWSSNFSVYFSTAADVVTDLCIMAMPLRLIYNVKVSFKQKAGLVCVFSLGFVMIVFAIIRANQSLAQQGFVNLTLLMVWSTLAASISVLVGTLPALKVLITAHARSSANRSNQLGDSAAGTIQSTAMRKNSAFGGNNGGGSQARSVALGSLRRDSSNTNNTSNTHNLKLGNRSNSEASESQEEILVQRDVTVSYTQRPSPTRYHQRFHDSSVV